MDSREVHSRFSEAGLRVFRNKASSTMMLADHDGLVILKFSEVIHRSGLATAHDLFYCDQFAEGGCTVEEIKAPSTALMDYMLHRFGELQKSVTIHWSTFIKENFELYTLKDSLLLVDKEGTIIARFEERCDRFLNGKSVALHMEMIGVDEGLLIGEKISTYTGASLQVFSELDKELQDTICRFTPFFRQVRSTYLHQEFASIPLSVVTSVCSNKVDASMPTDPIEIFLQNFS